MSSTKHNSLIFVIGDFTYTLNGVSLLYHMSLIGVTCTKSICMYAQDINSKQALSLHGLELRSRDCWSAALPIEV